MTADDKTPDAIDVEITHVEQDDEMVPLGDAETQMIPVFPPADTSECSEVIPEDTVQGGVKIVTPEEYIKQTPERNAWRAEMVADPRQVEAVRKLNEDLGDDPDGDIEGYDGPTEVAVLGDLLPVLPRDLDQIDFDEDFAVLRVLTNKIFRKAITDDAQMPDFGPDVEGQIEAVADLDAMWRDLNQARDGETDLDWRLAEWKAALAI